MLARGLKAALLVITHALPTISALGINCRGSILCDRATLSNQLSVGIIQILRDVIWASPKSNSTTYASGAHIICLSQSQTITFNGGLELDGITGGIGLSINSPQGGICLFPQYLTVANLDLEQIKPLVDAVLEHGCGTCGSVPIHFVDEGSNDPSDGILTFNYVQSPFCVGDCISDTGPLSSSTSSDTSSSSSSSSSSSTTFSSETLASVEGSTTVTAASPVAASVTEVVIPSSGAVSTSSGTSSSSSSSSSSSTTFSSETLASVEGSTTVTAASPVAASVTEVVIPSSGAVSTLSDTSSSSTTFSSETPASVEGPTTVTAAPPVTASVTASGAVGFRFPWHFLISSILMQVFEIASMCFF